MHHKSGPACLQAGQTLVELVIIMAVLVLIVGALVFATIASLRNAQFSNNLTQATKLAQEGLERVRVGRDRAKLVSNLNPVTSWNGSSGTLCSGTTDIAADSLWCYHISGNPGSCDSPTQFPTPGKCYFNIDLSGRLTNIGFNITTGFPSNAENEGSNPPLPKGFQRVITISDDLNHNNVFTDDDYQHQKEITAIVSWSDFAGPHESKITTILRKL